MTSTESKIVGGKVFQFTSFTGNQRKVISEEARAAAFTEIPVISLKTEKQQLVAEIKHACTKVGFFYIQDHGVPQKCIDDLIQAAQRFFHLPLKDKNEIHFKKSRHFRGYEGMGDNKTENGRLPDLNEQFNWGYEPSMDPAKSKKEIEEYQNNLNKNVMYGSNCWPKKCPELSQVVKNYYMKILVLARSLMGLFALALGLSEDYFAPMLETPGAMGRILHYLPQPADDNTRVGIGAHTDIECCTILYASMVPALQVLNNEGEWILATPIPNTFVINIGDMLARWSNDTFLSTVHRVKNLTGIERYSIPVFIGVHYDTIIEPLQTCIGRAGKKYPPVKAGDYVFRRLAKSRLEKQEYQKVLEETGVMDQ